MCTEYVQEDDWDSKVTAALDEECKDITQKLLTLRAELDQGTVTSDTTSAAGQKYLRTMEDMTRAQTELYNARLVALSDIFSQARIFVMTIDGCVQLASGLSCNSKLLRGLQYEICVIDEAHQVYFFHQWCQ